MYRHPTLGQRLGHLRVALDDAFQQSSRALGLTPQQAELLSAALTGPTVGDLAAALRCDRSNVSRLVDRATAHGLVARRTPGADGRVTIVELTPEGRRLADLFVEDLDRRTRSLFEGWPQKRQEAAGGILGEITAELERSCGPREAAPQQVAHKMRP
ncbi:MAG TPA: MarR family winged helix-turn-helix transcriptional regulator [Actinomycetota bacterium]|nr:MarR family winged helix-turn-helix transcriptional regulator [Actinomycetota bacterium]